MDRITTSSLTLLVFLLVVSGCATQGGAVLPAGTDPGGPSVDLAVSIEPGNDPRVTHAAPSGAAEPGSVSAEMPASSLTEAMATTPATATAAVEDEGSEDVEEDAEDENASEERLSETAMELIDRAQELRAAGEGDRALETLDQAYAAILKVSSEAGTKEAQQKEDLRFMISKRITEIYASRFTVANGTHKEIPLTINEHVQREIQLFQTLERNFFIESFRRSGRYRDMMVKALKEAGLPEDISWLPLIESGFKVRALSRARALGLWQFIPSTGYKFGLKRNDWVDERLDPEKATRAAVAYLKELHQIFGDWATVLAAYNCGEGAVLRVIREQKINYLDNFWDLYERLPRETARYYPRFLAVLAILKDPAKYGFELEGVDAPWKYEVVMMEKPVNLRILAEKIGCEPEDLSGLNPELRHEATPQSPYLLKVPEGKAEVVLAKLDSLPKWSPPRPAYLIHHVRRGESLSTIANRYRTSIQRIMEANHLRSGRLIRIGQKLKIPVRSAS